ncbi:MAG: VWA domain-containing protein [Candidatus Kapabacteria bacterium]|nr:VWA domain-containing protein [Ignavibacteriota bacterium]MCW5886223.1 VWA domain-containing protein [Candidatus Kapabacteria bacterium]
MSKTFFKIVILTGIISGVLLCSCSSTKPVSAIKVLDFKGVTEVARGEKANLKWNFENADKVRITDLQRNYNPQDSISIAVDTTSNYRFLITRGIDTLQLLWKVYVIDTPDEISTGPVGANVKNEKPSFINSDYLRGVQSAKGSANMKSLKIMRYYYPFESRNVVRAYSLILDEFGNYISGLSEKESGFVTINAFSGCIDSPKNSPVTGFTENRIDESIPVDYIILLDNSSIASDYFPINNIIEKFVKSLSDDDRFGLYLFNQNFKEELPLTRADEIMKLSFLFKEKGLSAIFKSLKYSIDLLNKSSDNSRKKVIVTIAYSTDNASIIYDRNDIIDLAIDSDIPIYVLGIGNAVDSYSLSSLSTLSGGRYYPVEDAAIENIQLILNEILYAQKANYQFDIPVPASGNCDTKVANIEFVTYQNRIHDTLKFPDIRPRHEFKYMAVASFDERDTTVTDDYLEPISMLADVLNKNPDLSIELIGNTSIEGGDKYCYNLGLKRAQAVRRQLIISGADPSKIRVSSDGSNNPVYYIQESHWMQYYNRRTELRWLDPELLPYEIIAQISETETDALSKVEDWEDKGYRAYYERYLQNNIPVYRVKIWGYKDQKSAEKIAGKLTKEYGFQFVVR